MRKLRGVAGALAATVLLLLVSGTPASASSITIGLPPTDGNCFPFNCNFDVGTRYQQVYAASDFAGPFVIADVTFFDTLFPGAVFTEADYVLSLSTTSATVNGLDTVNFANNVGADNTLVFSGHLSGPTGLSFTLGGSGVFAYDPALGNLLLDIQLSNIVTDSGSGFLDAHNGDAGGLFSRAHNFGSGFDSFGLVTGFDGPVTATPEPATLALLGVGLVGIAGRAWRQRKRLE